MIKFTEIELFTLICLISREDLYNLLFVTHTSIFITILKRNVHHEVTCTEHINPSPYINIENKLNLVHVKFINLVEFLKQLYTDCPWLINKQSITDIEQCKIYAYIHLNCTFLEKNHD